MRCMRNEKPSIQHFRLNLDKKSSVILENNLEVMLVEMNWLPLRIVRNGLLQIDPQFNTSIVVRVSTSKPQDVMGGGHAWVCTALLYAHDIESKLLHLGKQKV